MAVLRHGQDTCLRHLGDPQMRHKTSTLRKAQPSQSAKSGLGFGQIRTLNVTRAAILEAFT